eukprot:Amastigsp_a679616_100.p3 type:complete len:146 gc:universal Amastigsp_a679616_100:1060-623(-)
MLLSRSSFCSARCSFPTDCFADRIRSSGAWFWGSRSSTSAFWSSFSSSLWTKRGSFSHSSILRSAKRSFCRSTPRTARSRGQTSRRSSTFSSSRTLRGGLSRPCFSATGSFAGRAPCCGRSSSSLSSTGCRTLPSAGGTSWCSTS